MFSCVNNNHIFAYYKEKIQRLTRLIFRIISFHGAKTSTFFSNDTQIPARESHVEHQSNICRCASSSLGPGDL
uniref:Uncharacterized protein n=1 Tax=Strigamia maritima TaxID=126957 RepID=T1JHT5_STRMM